MINWETMNELIILCREKQINGEKILRVARALAEDDDGYEYAHVWCYGNSRGIYVGFNFSVKYYLGCPYAELDEAIYKYINETFPELNLAKLEIPDCEKDWSLISEKCDLVIERPTQI